MSVYFKSSGTKLFFYLLCQDYFAGNANNLPCPPALLPRTAKQRGCGNKTPLFGASEAFWLKLNF